MLGTSLSRSRYQRIFDHAVHAPHWLDLKPGEFESSYNRRPFVVRHRLADDPHFSLESLVRLARRVPRNKVLFRTGIVPIDTDFDLSGQAYRKSLTLEDALDRMEEVQSYVVLNNPEYDAEYRPVIEGILGEIALCSDHVDPYMNWYSTYVFISAHDSVTPYHMDREMNFLLQVRGTKTVRLWDPFDDVVMTPAQKDELLSHASDVRPQYHEGLASRAMLFDLKPGLGVHHPFIAPHLVHTGKALSISLAVTFRTLRSDVWRDAHRMNYSLRHWGLRPTPVGKNYALDLTKAGAVRTVRAVRSLTKRPPEPARASQ
jgi:hypothetical protein